MYEGYDPERIGLPRDVALVATIRQLQEKLLAHTENEGSECPLCQLEAECDAVSELMNSINDELLITEKENDQHKAKIRRLARALLYRGQRIDELEIYHEEVKAMSDLMFQYSMQRIHNQS